MGTKNFISLCRACIFFLLIFLSQVTVAQVKKLQQPSGGLKGYITMRIQPPPDGFGYGISFYSGVWPLLDKSLSDFQIGLPSTWIIPDNRGFNEPLCPPGTIARDNWDERGPSYRDVFQTIEGGLGFWASTQFSSTTPKFRINGTPNCYNSEISSPGWGFGNPDPLDANGMGLAQLSNRLVIPPDGLTFEQGDAGDLFGNAWMVLPLMEAKAKKAADDVPTGNQSWTVFINAANFKGPLAFYVPAVWSRIAKGYPTAEGRSLDAKPGIAGGGAMEVNTVPYFESTDAKGTRYSKVPRLQFPVNKEGNTVLMQDVTMYSADALYRQMELMITSGNIVNGQFNNAGAYTAKCKTLPIVLKQGDENIKLTDLSPAVETTMFGESSFGLNWKSAKKTGYFPEYFKKQGDSMIAITAAQVPAETHLREQTFTPGKTGKAYTSPKEKGTVWTTPGPKAGPYTASLKDGSVITYYWYRFTDQPSIQSLALSTAEKERLQKMVEFIHTHWTTDKQYMSAPSRGKLASLDKAILVNPPKGLEIGYVPVVVRQSGKDQ
ncbi:hypothetical protein [Agriterribacter humi]|uniref:hypothetical protein n=1 Tax=Agriterribacter humi TaxID=1104781 RepID=UPI001264B494|nr:hypothetical protein [Agriterribacter humi]